MKENTNDINESLQVGDNHICEASILKSQAYTCEADKPYTPAMTKLITAIERGGDEKPDSSFVPEYIYQAQFEYLEKRRIETINRLSILTSEIDIIVGKLTTNATHIHVFRYVIMYGFWQLLEILVQLRSIVVSLCALEYSAERKITYVSVDYQIDYSI